MQNETQSEVLDRLHLTTIVQDVLRRWYLILAVTILAAAAACVVTQLRYRPEYETRTTFVVSTRGSSATVYQNLSATTNLASVLSEVLNSSVLRRAILDELQVSGFEGTISAAAVEETNLITLRVTAADPRTAFLVNRAIIEHHSVVTAQLLGDIALEVLQKPQVPTAPVRGAGVTRRAMQAAALAFAAMCALFAFSSYLRDTVRTRQEAEQKLDCRCLAEIPHERRYKSAWAWLRRRRSSLLVTDSTTGFRFCENMRKLRRRVEQLLPQGGVLLVTSAAEHEGKSTVAVNLALSLAQKHSRVLLIDGDLRRPACRSLLRLTGPEGQLADVLAGKRLLEDAVQQDPRQHLSVLAGGAQTASAVRRLLPALPGLLAQARERYDYLILDMPPMQLVPDAESVAGSSDAALLVVQQNRVTADDINDAAAALRASGCGKVDCVLNNVYAAPMESGGAYGYGHYGRYGYGYYAASGRRQTAKVENDGAD